MLSRLFNIRAAEWPRFLVLYAMAFLFFLGLTWGETIMEAALLVALGVNFLPLVFALHGVFFILATAIYTLFVDRVPHGALLIAIIVASGLTVAAGGGLLLFQAVAVAAVVLGVTARVVRSAFSLHWWTYVGSFYDTRTAKRVIPVLSSSSRTAIIAAGLTMPLLNATLSPAGIVALWVGSLALVGGIAALLGRSRSAALGPAAVPAQRPSSRRQRQSYAANVQEGYRYVAQSSYLRWMALAAVMLVVVFSLLNYQGSKIMKAELVSREAIANFVGHVNWITNLIFLPFQLFIFNRIVNRMGLDNASLIYPAATAAIAGVTVASLGSLATAALTLFQRTTLRFAVYEPTNNLLYNAVPLHIKGRARAFIDGLMVPVGLLLGSGVVLLLRLTSHPWLFVSLLVVATLVFVASTWIVRRKYGAALITMLEQEDFSFLLTAPDELMVADPLTLKRLTEKLRTSTNPELTVFLAKMITEIGGAEAIGILDEAVRGADPKVRASLINVISAAELGGDRVGRLYTDMLNDPDGHVREASIRGLEQWAGADSEKFLDLSLEVLDDPDLDVRIHVLPALMRSGDVFYQTAAFQLLSHLLNHPDAARRAQGINILGQINDSRFIRHLVQYVTDQEDEVRLEAALMIEVLAQNPLSPRLGSLLLEPLSRASSDPIERVRQAALSVLGLSNRPEAQQTLLGALGDPSPQIRETAVAALVRGGPAAVPSVTAALASFDDQQRKIATVVLARISRERYEAAILDYVDANLREIYRAHSLLQALQGMKAPKSVAIVLSTLREQNDQRSDEVFYLLSALYPADTINVIRETLANPAPHVRANAAEALEALTSPRLPRLIGPLFDPDVAGSTLLEIGRQEWQVEQFTAKTALEHLLTRADSDWLRTVATYVLGEIGAMQEVQPATTIRRRSSPLLDLLVDAPKDSGSGVLVTTTLFTPKEVERLLSGRLNDSAAPVQEMAGLALQKMQQAAGGRDREKEHAMLSIVDKIIFLKEVSFFQGMTIEQLKVLANACEETFFAEDTAIFTSGEPGGVLYVVVNGRVAIEQESGPRRGSTVRLSTLDSHGSFGEMNLFDNSPHNTTALAIQDTLTLRLRREPLIALARQYPSLSLELINVLSQRLRESNEQIARLTRSKPRELHKVFDRLEDPQPDARATPRAPGSDRVADGAAE
jgi:CRP-like cAMP-binding protein/ATP/ADP translocase/HEAT repeat protein